MSTECVIWLVLNVVEPEFDILKQLDELFSEPLVCHKLFITIYALQNSEVEMVLDYYVWCCSWVV